MVFWPWKLKATKSVDRIVNKIDSITNKWKKKKILEEKKKTIEALERQRRLKKKQYFLKNVKYDNVKLQKKYNSHAKDFGIYENYNLNNRDIFKNKLNTHLKLEWTKMMEWTHRSSQKVKHFYNKETWINTMYDLEWNFVSWWKLWQSQIENLLRNWNIQ